MLRASQPYLFPIVLLLAWLGATLGPVQAQVLPLDQKNTITGNWMVQRDGETQLVPYVAGVHDNYNALHQWLPVSQAQPFNIAFAAPQNLCLFLNNRLIFKADFAANYTLNLTDYTRNLEPVQGKYLLTVWHPAQQPNVRSFRNAPRTPDAAQRLNQRPFSIQVRDYVNQNAFIIFMLLIGLLYGVLRVNYPADFQQMFSFNRFFSSTQREELYATKPVSSVSNMLFLLAFSLSLALLITAIHTNLQHVKLFNRLFPVSEADITTKVIFYTIMVFSVVLLKYIFLKVMSFIFGLEQVVELQYMEFMRSLLFLGLFLPLVMLLYLGLNAVLPDAIVLVSSLAVSFVLVITILRVFAAVNKKASVLNLHLFSYLCATEVIPLAIILKLIVFNY
ncbi:DUF4271 domain-containing protein [Pontibacter akesuensis]|uniref:DUF4271 domain-containing protein n=1 Tax=Pontibacter akesuensis TaxID=388950 RepID=A0A1I7I9K1_9BACT|nr:DUF4271 domain-containing protein [Pontibacter akesuensis]SFU69520.1 protein of unknown function [Pontibacter akesuensis]